MNNNSQSLPLPWTGERYLPEIGGDIELEHLHRYIIAAQFVVGKKVLDIASGEGYGSDKLAAFANYVIGVDIDVDAVTHARSTYRKANLEFRVGSASAIPVETATIDVVVSFETIEHHEQHEKMMVEIKRVLRPGGLLIISSPNRRYYSLEANYSNPHHVKELFTDEFESLLHRFFGNVQIFGQRVVYGSLVAPQKAGVTRFLSLSEENEVEGLSKPVYDLAFASDMALLELRSSLFEMPVNGKEAMLAGKDVDWSERLSQTARDFEAEIARIAVERDAMLKCKDAVIQSVMPKVSVITVNFNGKDYLSGLLKSLSLQTLPPAEIIVVDNASTDGSVAFLENHFPGVRIIRSDSNLGFAGGNNLGVEAASYPLVALINNDAVVSLDWLEHLVGTWVQRSADGQRVGAISSKIRFLKKFLTFRFISETYSPNVADDRSLGVAIDIGRTQITGVDYAKPIIVSGFHGEERWPGDRVVRWTSGDAELMLPIDEVVPGAPSVLHISAKSTGMSGGVEVIVYCAGSLLGSCRVMEEFTEIDIEIPADFLSSAEWVVNNAGSKLDRFGNAADIGINQPDHGQYDTSGDLEAFCGCSVLIPRNLFLGLKGFDESFFMYYEDADLSWRMRRSGYRIVFEPRSVVQHIHAGSSVEWSPNFRYHVTRNYRLNGIKNAALPQMLFLLMRLPYAYLRRLIKGGINVRHHLSGVTLNTMSPAQIEIKALGDAILMVSGILFNRVKTQFRRVFSR